MTNYNRRSQKYKKPKGNKKCIRIKCQEGVYYCNSKFLADGCISDNARRDKVESLRGGQGRIKAPTIIEKIN